jgi:hypothetical protein
LDDDEFDCFWSQVAIMSRDDDMKVGFRVMAEINMAARLMMNLKPLSQEGS